MSSERKSSPEYSVVVPVYRGRQTIEELCRRTVQFFESRGESFEIILVDDSSSDGSWEEIARIAQLDPQVLGIRLMQNFGQDNATVCGFRHASGRFVVTMDEDLQNPPEEIGKMIAAMRRENADVVYGTPENKQHTWWRRLGSWLVLAIPRRAMRVDFDISSFRLIRYEALQEVMKSVRHDVIIDVYLGWVTRAITAVTVRHEEALRPSSYSLYKLIKLTVDLYFSYTVTPLRAVMFIGAGISLVSILLGSIMIYQRLIDNVPVPGFTSLIVTNLFSTGVIVIGIGILAEYVARLFLHWAHKPQYVVRQTTREDGNAKG